MEFADILSSLRRRWKISVGILLLTGAVLAAFLVTREETQPAARYRAESDILVPARDEDGNLPEGVPPPLLFGQAAIATADEVREAALDDAEVTQEQRRGIAFGYSTSDGGRIITLSVQARDALIARAVADAWAERYIDERGEDVANGIDGARERTYRSIELYTARLGEVRSELASIDPNLLLLLPTVTSEDTEEDETTAASDVPFDLPIDTALLIYERAELQSRIEGARRHWAERTTASADPYADVVEIPPVANVTPPVDSPGTPTALIIGIGILLAFVLPVLIDRMDHTIRDAKTATAAFSAPVLSSIPAVSRSRRDEIAAPGTAREAAFRALAATSVATDRLPRSIVVTSALGDEQDAVAANFAAALAGLGVRVALIGTSPRQSWFAQSALIGSGNGAERATTTFPELLELAYSGRLNGETPEYLQRTDIENLFVLPPGQTDIDVSNDGLAPMLQALSNANIDVTVIAAPALLEDPNTTIYAWTTRSVLWVMETGEITLEEAREAASRLSLAGVTPLGVAMVDQES